MTLHSRAGGAVQWAALPSFFPSSCNPSLYRQDPGRNRLTLFPSLPYLSVIYFSSLTLFFISTLYFFKCQSYQKVESKCSDTQAFTQTRALSLGTIHILACWMIFGFGSLSCALCGILAASVVSTYQILVAPFQMRQPKMSPDITKCLLRGKSLNENHWCINKYSGAKLKIQQELPPTQEKHLK